MSRLLYSLTLYLLLPFTLIKLVWRSLRQPDYLKHWGERYAFKFPSCPSNSIWLHCVSVGETRAAAPLIKSLIKRYPDTAILLTHTTPTGRETGNLLFPAEQYPTVYRCYLPYDTPDAIVRFLKHFQPKLGVLLETELWFNLIAGCDKQNIPLLLVNARLSEQSAKGYAQFSGMSAQALQSLRCIGAQTMDDAKRLEQLRHSDSPKIAVTGNLKFDVELAPDYQERGKSLRVLLGSNSTILLIASSREGEEALILQALSKSPLLADSEQTKVIIVPRHPQRFDEVAKLIEKYGFRYCRRSEFAIGNVAGEIAHAKIILGDSMGEMPIYYAASDLAFIGGSLLPFGGQNLIEACAVGTPVLLGKHTFNFAQASELAIAYGAAQRISNTDELLRHAADLLTDKVALQSMRNAAKKFVQENQGATKKTLALITQELDKMKLAN